MDTETPKYDEATLNKELDRVKGQLMQKRDLGFLVAMLCTMSFEWDSTIQTAATNGLKLWWNPEFFMGLSKEARETVLEHELWHPALLHMLRKDARDQRLWNMACDYRINNNLKSSGRSFAGLDGCCLDDRFDNTPDGPLNEEAIYDILLKEQPEPPPANSPLNGDDMRPLSPGERERVVNNVVSAAQRAKLMGGKVPGCVQEVIDEFLKPIVPWQSLLQRFFMELISEEYSWHRPNRRFPDMYLPSPDVEETKLKDLVYFLDVSGSISTEQVRRFNSEVKYIKEQFNPEKLTMVQFDTGITRVDEMDETDCFEKVEVVGRGGTSLVAVRQYIIDHKPTAAIIFSDLCCYPMDPLPQGLNQIPVIWVVTGNDSAQVEFGRKIHID